MIDQVTDERSEMAPGVSELHRIDVPNPIRVLPPHGARGPAAAVVAYREAAPAGGDVSGEVMVVPRGGGMFDITPVAACEAAFSGADADGDEGCDGAAEGVVVEARGEACPATSALARHVLTAAPLVAADVIALIDSAVFGLLAVYVLSAIGLPGLGRFSADGAARLPWACAMIQLPMILAYWHRGLYPGAGVHPAVELRRVAELNATAGMAAAAALLAAGASPAWAAFVAGSCLASIGLVPLARWLARGQCARRSWWGCPALVVGTGPSARQTTQALLDRPQCGFRPAGMIDPTGESAGAVRGVPFLADAADGAGDGDEAARPSLPSAAYAIVSLSGLPANQIDDLLERYRRRFPHVLVLPDARSVPGSCRGSEGAQGGLACTELHNQLLFSSSRLVKRATDIALASAALALGLPTLAAVALAVKLSSPGPLLFGHQRLGRGGRSFTTWKFRTMRVNAQEVLRDLLANDPEARREWEQDHKLRKDPRVTPIGNFLRKSSLDELPQLWNVLVGDMSLVGPRPIVEAEIPKYGRDYALYEQVRPGITGLWQVSGRNNTTYAERVRLDRFYARNWSPWLDALILVRTVKTIIGREGAF